MELALIRTPANTLIPATPQDREFISTLKSGQMLKGKFSRIRNSAFHRKFFALLNLAYEYWEPQPVTTENGITQPEKNFDAFRKWVTIAAGYFDWQSFPDGSVLLHPKSIAFTNMDEHTFGQFYSAVLDVLFRYLLHEKGGFMSTREVEMVTTELMGFA